MKLAPYKIALVLSVIILIAFIINRHTGNLNEERTAKRKVSHLYRDYVHVCMAFDENDIMGAIAAINSIHVHSKYPVYFHLVTDKATQPILSSWLEGSVLANTTYEIMVFDTDELAGKIKIRGSREELGNVMNYVRFYYPELFQSLHGKILHIDSDVIVQADIFDMYATELKPGHIAAFSDDCSSSMKRYSSNQNTYGSFLNFNHDTVKCLGLKPGMCSFNAGVYVFDVDLWRQNNVTKQLEFWLELNTRDNIYGAGRAEGGSQPPMMIVFYDKYTHLDPLWNLRYLGQNPKVRYSEHFIKHGKLLHWNGPFKPWNGVAQLKKLWDKYYIPDPTGKHVPVRKTSL